MQSTSLLSRNAVDISSINKSEVSKGLFGQIQWDDIIRSGVSLQARDHQLLERAQANLAVVLDNEQDAKDFAIILIKIADQCQNNLIVQQYVFTRIEEVLGLSNDYSDTDIEVFGNKNSRHFFSDNKNIIDGPFLRAINSPDNYLQRSASKGLASLFSVGHGNIASLVSWINNKLVSTTAGVWEMALPTLIILVRSAEARQVFIKNGGLGLVVSQLNKIGANGNAQHIYDLCFILWCLTLSSDVDINAFFKSGTISTLSDFLAKAPSRKVARVIVAGLKILATTENNDILTEMFSSNLDKVLLNLSSSSIVKQSSDFEFDSDFKVLNDILLKNHRDLSTFDRWVSEVQSGALRWGVVHNEKFWKENAKFVEVGEFKMLKELISLIDSSDPTIVCIALYDLGEFTRFYPNGRVVTSKLGGKDLVMQKIGDSDPTIQRYALQAISKIMITSWEFMK